MICRFTLLIAITTMVVVPPAASQDDCLSRGSAPLPEPAHGPERVAYDHFLVLLSIRVGPDALSKTQIRRMRRVGEIIWNEQAKHPCLRYLRRLGAPGYAAFAITKRGSDKNTEVLKLDLITKPTEPIRSVSTESGKE